MFRTQSYVFVSKSNKLRKANMLLRNFRTCKKIPGFARSTSTNSTQNNNVSKTRNVSPLYIQGQEPEPKIREYFYYIDHQGMLFLDDSRMKNFTSCFKEKKFLKFFFNQLRKNDTNRYTEFPYVSICGKERNFVRCDDYPFVFTHIFSRITEDKGVSEHRLAHNYADDLLSLKFEPQKIFMLPDTGRVYHPAPKRAGSVGLVRSKLAIELSRYFDFKNGEGKPPTHFTFDGKTYELDKEWYYKAVKQS